MYRHVLLKHSSNSSVRSVCHKTGRCIWLGVGEKGGVGQGFLRGVEGS